MTKPPYTDWTLDSISVDAKASQYLYRQVQLLRTRLTHEIKARRRAERENRQLKENIEFTNAVLRDCM